MFLRPAAIFKWLESFSGLSRYKILLDILQCSLLNKLNQKNYFSFKIILTSVPGAMVKKAKR